MGAIADAIVAYAQPLLERTDGSEDQMNKALMIAQLCWNCAICPEAERESLLSHMQPAFQMDDVEFDAFRRDIVGPMIQRHVDMFPLLHGRELALPIPYDDPPVEYSRTASEPFAGAAPYEPCPCNSGKKYKFCCRSKRR